MVVPLRSRTRRPQPPLPRPMLAVRMSRVAEVMDLDALREAVERLDAGRDPWQLSADEQLALAAAARAVLDSEEAWRCDTHKADFLERDPDEYAMCIGLLYEDRWNTLPEPDPCKPVRRRLLAEEDGE